MKNSFLNGYVTLLSESVDSDNEMVLALCQMFFFRLRQLHNDTGSFLYLFTNEFLRSYIFLGLKLKILPIQLLIDSL